MKPGSILYIFDLDGTLIESFLEEVTCPRCIGRCVIHHDRGDEPCGLERCPQCRGRGTWLKLVEEGYDCVDLLPKRERRIRDLWYAGHSIAIATNQTGVAYGFQTEEQVQHKLATVVVALSPARIDVHVCTDPTPGVCRKPAPSMLQAAMRNAGAERWQTIFIGDMFSDRDAANNAGVAFQWAHHFFGDDRDPGTLEEQAIKQEEQ